MDYQKFKDALRQTGDPRQAFETAIISHTPFPPNRSCSLIIAFPSSPTPTLLSFNLNNDQRIIEEREGYCLPIGSIPEMYKKLSSQLLDLLAEGFYNNPRWFLTSALAFLQSYGMYDYRNVLEKGVGGAFCGLFIGEHSIEWQSDILFLLYDLARDSNINLVASTVRDHVLVVRSLANNSIRYLLNPISCDSFEDWEKKWNIPVLTFLIDGRFDFVVLFSRRFRIITIIEMFKQRSNQFLNITPLPNEGQLEQFSLDSASMVPATSRMDIGFSPLLCEIMDEATPDMYDGSIPIAINWYPYCSTCQGWTSFLVQSGEPAMCSICRTPL
jgi:hypothetical protein